MTSQENNCFICWNSLDEKEFGRKKIIHNYDGSNDKWEHACHEKCLKIWCKQCITVKEVYPKCPICASFRIPIEKIPVSFRHKALEILEDEEDQEEEDDEQEEEEEAQEEDDEQEQEDQEEEEAQAQVVYENRIPWHVQEANKRLGFIHQNYDRGPHFAKLPFLGIMVCYQGNIIIKHTSSYYHITIASTLDRLKTEILSKNVEISKSIGVLNSKNLAHNIKLSNWFNWTHPNFQITNVHYGIPPYTCQFEELDSALDLRESVLLSDIYLEYQTNAGRIYNHGEDLKIAEAYRRLCNVYKKTNVQTRYPAGPDDPGDFVGVYRNSENPYINDKYCYNNGAFGNQTTHDSLSWLVFHVDFLN
jgi:hypothetical protein